MPLIYVDSGTIDRIVEIPHDTAGGLTPPSSAVTTWTLPTAISQPQAVVIDSNGNVYVADNSSNEVYRVNLPDGGGNATVAQTINLPSDISDPIGLAIDSSGNLYIADDTGNVHRISLSSLTFTNDIANPANSDFDRINLPSAISRPHGLAIDSNGNLYISDTTTMTFIESRYLL